MVEDVLDEMLEAGESPIDGLIGEAATEAACTAIALLGEFSMSPELNGFGAIVNRGEEGADDMVEDIDRGLPEGLRRGNSCASCSKCLREVVLRARSNEIVS